MYYLIFESKVEQMVAHWAHDPKVIGSNPIFAIKFLEIPQFDILCFGTLVWSLIIILSLFYLYLISNIIPFFVEIKKFRIKKNSVDNLLKQTVIINKNLNYNSKLKRFSI